jgi:DNA/RNA-binding protein KIN17
MPKAEAGSAKDIANKIKSKGLQKLKFYCQMCEKQCRDANGFKCHLTSDSHLRQMKIFSDNAGGILDRYSKDFEQMFMATLRMRHGTKKVNANNIYQEVIADKQHIHMNATHWVTLTDFVQYLGKTGKCIVEETERGWYISYIERDASILARQEALEKRLQSEQQAEQVQAERMEHQRVEAAKALDRAGGTVHLEATKLERVVDEENGEELKIKLNPIVSTQTKKHSMTAAAKKGSVFDDGDDEEEEDDKEDPLPAPAMDLRLPAAPHSASNLAATRRRHEDPNSFFSSHGDDRRGNRKRPREGESPNNQERDRDDDIGERSTLKRSQRDNKERGTNDKEDATKRNDYWLYRNILVRVISKRLANGKYFKRKGIVDRVMDDKYSAEVEILDSGPDVRDGGDMLRLDQEDLETVIPKEGKRVRILNNIPKNKIEKGGGWSPLRGQKAIVVSLNKKKCYATLELEDIGVQVERVPYEDFSKLA